MDANTKSRITGNIKKFILGIFQLVIIVGICYVILGPVIGIISRSFFSDSDAYSPMVYLIPQDPTTFRYKLAIKYLEYTKTMGLSLLYSLTLMAIQVFICSMVGYGFARFDFPLKKFWFACVILVILIPPQTIASSLHLHFRFFDILGIFKLIRGEAINLRGSKLPYYLMSAGCMGLKNGLYIYMIRQFFRNIPEDMEEAAYVDGCGMFKTFIRIMLPEAKPILTSCFLFAFVWQWTDGFYAKMFLGGTTLVSTSLARIVDSLGAYLSRILGVKTTVSIAYSNCILATGTLMIIMPLIILYLFAQRAFVESISSSGIKM